MTVLYTRKATANLDAACIYIARDRPAAAHGVGQRIRGAIARLARYPEMGRPGRVAGTRELVIPGLSYVAAYRIRGGAVDVLAIFHAARRWPSAF